MNTMMTTILRKISVISMIIIIMNEFKFATTDDTMKTCKGWILNDGYKEKSIIHIFNSDRNHNHNTAKNRNDPDVNSDTSNISIFGLVYGQFLNTLKLKNVIKPSAFCELIGVFNSDHEVPLVTQSTQLKCPDWIQYYGYSYEDGKEEENWNMSQKLRIHTGIRTLFHYIHGITERYLREIKKLFFGEDAFSVLQFCNNNYGDELYPYKTGEVTRKDAIGYQETEIQTSTANTAYASSSKTHEVYYSDLGTASSSNIYEKPYIGSAYASSSKTHEDLHYSDSD